MVTVKITVDKDDQEVLLNAYKAWIQDEVGEDEEAYLGQATLEKVRGWRQPHQLSELHLVYDFARMVGLALLEQGSDTDYPRFRITTDGICALNTILASDPDYPFNLEKLGLLESTPQQPPSPEDTQAFGWTPEQAYAAHQQAEAPIERPARITVEEYVDQEYAKKVKRGDCSVYWDQYSVDEITRDSEFPDLYSIRYGMVNYCTINGYVRLKVIWKDQTAPSKSQVRVAENVTDEIVRLLKLAREQNLPIDDTLATTVTDALLASPLAGMVRLTVNEAMTMENSRLNAEATTQRKRAERSESGLKKNVQAYLRLCEALDLHGSAEQIILGIKALKKAQRDGVNLQKKWDGLWQAFQKGCREHAALLVAAADVYDFCFENDQDRNVRRLRRVLKVLGGNIVRNPDGSYRK